MRCTTSTAKKIAICGLIAVTASSTGCKSGWKMPGASMFAWGKKPSEETLAGKGPTMTTPTSPATTQTPSLLAGSNGKSAAPKASPYMPSGAPATATTNSLASRTPNTSPYGAAPTAPATAGMGTAATANGYATGPYNTFAQQSNPYAAAGTTYTGTPANAYAQAAVPPAAAMSPATARTASANNAYPGLGPNVTSGSFGAPTHQPQLAQGQMQMPAGQMQMPAGQPQFAQQAPGGVPGASGPMYSMPNMMPGQPTNMPPSAPSGFASMPSNVPMMGAPTNTAPMAPSTTAYAPVGANAATGSLSSFAAPPAAVPSSGTVQASTASFRPGSTQRATGYDFSSGSQVGTPVTGAPNTATSTSNPGYQLPPTGAISR